MADGLNQIESQLKQMGISFAQALETNLNVDRIKQKFRDVETQAFNIAKSFGVGRDNILNIKASMTDLVDSAKKYGMTFEDVAGITKGISEDLGRNVLLNKESGEKVLATSKVLRGMGMEFSNVASSFKDVGVSYMGVGSQVEKVVATARKMGVNASAVVKDVVANLDKLNKYNFKGGVEGLSKMVAQSKILRINMGQIFELADKAFNPEGAIEMAAAMQRLGVTQSDLLDPLRLMDLSANDPGELMNQLGKMSEKFVQLNKDGRFEIMPGAKRQLREIAKELQIDYNELTKMAVGTKELDMKLSKIKFPSTFTEEQRQFIANMAEIGPGGEMTLRVGGEEKSIEEAMSTFARDQKALDKFMKDSEPKTMEQLARDQLTIMEDEKRILEQLRDRTGYGLASSEGFETLTQTQRELTDAVVTASKSTTFSAEGMRKGIGKQSNELIKALSEGDMSKSGQVLLDMGIDIAKIPGEIGKSVEDAYKGLQTSENVIIKAFVPPAEKTTAKPTPATTTPEPATIPTPVMGQFNELMKAVQTPSTSNQTMNYDGKMSIDINVSGSDNVDTKTLETSMYELFKNPKFLDFMRKKLVDPNSTLTPEQLNLLINVKKTP
jgi:hypothetical protein